MASPTMASPTWRPVIQRPRQRTGRGSLSPSDSGVNDDEQPDCRGGSRDRGRNTLHITQLTTIAERSYKHRLRHITQLTIAERSYEHRLSFRMSIRTFSERCSAIVVSVLRSQVTPLRSVKFLLPHGTSQLSQFRFGQPREPDNTEFGTNYYVTPHAAIRRNRFSF